MAAVALALAAAAPWGPHSTPRTVLRPSPSVTARRPMWQVELAGVQGRLSGGLSAPLRPGCVVEHLVERRSRIALLITDGVLRRRRGHPAQYLPPVDDTSALLLRREPDPKRCPFASFVTSFTCPSSNCAANARQSG